MRKITHDIVLAFFRGEERTIGNSFTDGNRLLLHNNLIAERFVDGSIWVTAAGWNTPTTRERLNGVCQLFRHNRNEVQGFCQIQFQLHAGVTSEDDATKINYRTIHDTDWVRITGDYLIRDSHDEVLFQIGQELAKQV